MLYSAHIRVSVIALAAVAASLLLPLAQGQDQFAQSSAQPAVQEILARSRVFPGVGAGVVAMKRDAAGHYYILAAPPSAVLIYGADGKRVGEIPNAHSGAARIVYAEDMDAAADGRVYVADRGSNAVKIFNSDGSLALTIPVIAPTSVTALSGGECAVVSRRSDHLVDILDAQGKQVRSFGDLSDLGSHANPDQLLHRGRLAGDPAGHIYFAFSDLPVPTIRKYDRYGYAAYEISLSPSELASGSQSPPREFVTFESRSEASPIQPVNAIAVDPATQEVWAAIGGDLVHFDKDGNLAGDYRTAADDGSRITPAAILVEPKRILVAGDRLGIFDFARPDKQVPVAARR
jgi:hypothetical protein